MSETRERVDLLGGNGYDQRESAHESAPLPASPKNGTVSVIELKTPEKARGLTVKAHDRAPQESSQTKRRKKSRRRWRLHRIIRMHSPLGRSSQLADEKMQSAEEDLDHAVKVDPNYAPAYLVLGAVFNQLGRYDEALRSLDRGSMYDPKVLAMRLRGLQGLDGKTGLRACRRAVESCRTFTVQGHAGAHPPAAGLRPDRTKTFRSGAR